MQKYFAQIACRQAGSAIRAESAIKVIGSSVRLQLANSLKNDEISS